MSSRKRYGHGRAHIDLSAFVGGGEAQQPTGQMESGKLAVGEQGDVRPVMNPNTGKIDRFEAKDQPWYRPFKQLRSDRLANNLTTANTLSNAESDNKFFDTQRVEELKSGIARQDKRQDFRLQEKGKEKDFKRSEQSSSNTWTRGEKSKDADVERINKEDLQKMARIGRSVKRLPEAEATLGDTSGITDEELGFHYTNVFGKDAAEGLYKAASQTAAVNRDKLRDRADAKDIEEVTESNNKATIGRNVLARTTANQQNEYVTTTNPRFTSDSLTEELRGKRLANDKTAVDVNTGRYINVGDGRLYSPPLTLGGLNSHGSYRDFGGSEPVLKEELAYDIETRKMVPSGKFNSLAQKREPSEEVIYSQEQAQTNLAKLRAEKSRREALHGRAKRTAAPEPTEPALEEKPLTPEEVRQLRFQKKLAELERNQISF